MIRWLPDSRTIDFLGVFLSPRIKHSSLVASVRNYEAWLSKALDGDIVEADLDEKHQKMAGDAFVFLRATYWRWAETARDVFGDFADGPSVLGVGDVHLENFGTWRDEEGRLVWGVNDFDEAAEMPYALDLIRLTTSAFLAGKVAGQTRMRICEAVLGGYREGLQKPEPFILDEARAWLRRVVEISAKARKKFWKKFTPPPLADRGDIPRRFERTLVGALPKPVDAIETWPRGAGTGSLGRPRWVARAMWRGAPVVREAKAVVQSAWSRVHDPRAKTLSCAKLARSKFRSPDPKYELAGSIVVRRLSPNNRKIEVEDDPLTLLAPRMLHAMSHELANLHGSTASAHAAIARDLDRREPDWLKRAATAAATFVQGEHAEWKRHCGMTLKKKSKVP
jgi:hypothetical protein